MLINQTKQDKMRILSCFVWLKSVLFNLFSCCVFLIFVQNAGSQLCFRILFSIKWKSKLYHRKTQTDVINWFQIPPPFPPPPNLFEVQVRTCLLSNPTVGKHNVKVCSFSFNLSQVSDPQWGATDTDIKVPSGENTELKLSLFKA